MFEFLKYVMPMWYYRLHGKSEVGLFSDAELQDLESQGRIRPCLEYFEKGSERMDLVFQALQNGAIPRDRPSAATVLTVKSVKDNYIFLSRHFPSKWSWYVFTLRMLTFHNPFAECIAFARSRGRRRVQRELSDNYPDFRSHSLGERFSKSLVSVIIPTLNRYGYLKDVMDDLEKQDHGNLEVVVCDQSEPFEDTLYSNRRFPVKVIRQSEKALWKARNECFKASRGDFILLFDDDSRVASDWVSQHLRCLSYFDVKISAGVTETLVGHGLSPKDGFFHMSDVFDTGNAMVCREVFEKVGLFDRQFEKQRMGDGEFGLRAYLAGYAVISNPHATRIHLKADEGGLRHFGGWDAFRPGRLFAPRPIPSVLYFCRRYFGRDSSLCLLLNSLPSSVIPYKHKGSRKAKWLAPLLMPIVGPVLVMQAVVSWKLSGRMIEEGPRIDFPEVVETDNRSDIQAKASNRQR
jgi:glycosyltransferase involved in cell wall biosynthesis